MNVLPASSQQNTRNWTLGRACQELLTAKSDGPKHFILLHLKEGVYIQYNSPGWGKKEQNSVNKYGTQNNNNVVTISTSNK